MHLQLAAINYPPPNKKSKLCSRPVGVASAPTASPGYMGARKIFFPGMADEEI